MKLFLLTLVLFATVAQAAEVTILEKEITLSGSYGTTVSTKFYMDQNTMEGFAKVSVTENFDRQTQMPREVVVFQDKVKIESLMLMADQVVYHSREGSVNCGVMKESRFFHVPTLYLTGNCKLEGQIVKDQGMTKLVVTLITK